MMWHKIYKQVKLIYEFRSRDSIYSGDMRGNIRKDHNERPTDSSNVLFLNLLFTKVVQFMKFTKLYT